MVVVHEDPYSKYGPVCVAVNYDTFSFLFFKLLIIILIELSDIKNLHKYVIIYISLTLYILKNIFI